MVDLKLVLSTADGKSYQKDVKGEQGDALLGKRIGETLKGDDLGFAGYEFLLTGGSDKCGFPMRKGIQFPRKEVMLSGGVGFNGKDRNKKKQKGLVRKKTVCGEWVTKIIHQVNLKVLKEGAQKLGEQAAQQAPAQAE